MIAGAALRGPFGAVTVRQCSDREAPQPCATAPASRKPMFSQLVNQELPTRPLDFRVILMKSGGEARMGRRPYRPGVPAGSTWATITSVAGAVLSRCVHALSCVLAVVVLTGWSAAAFAQTDEIQVYDAEIAEPGVWNLMVHNNYTFNGATSPRFDGGIVPNHTLNGVPEWAYGVTPWFEQGFYVPLYSEASNLGPVFNGVKVRELFVVPDAAKQTFFYGINFEFSFNADHWDEHRYTSEIRP